LEFSRSTPGVSTCLVGTKTPEHLRDILEVAGRPSVPEAAFSKAFS
jgi:aryl-alcohol dehydrogenase-like predicted oxidoreductase